MSKKYLWLRYFSRFKDVTIVLFQWITDGGDNLIADDGDNIVFR